MNAKGTRLSWLDDAVPATVYLGLIAFMVGDALFVQMSTATRVGYAAAAAAALFLPVALVLAGRIPPPRTRRMAAIVAACSAAFLLPAALLPQGRTLQHVVVDFTTTLVPIGFLLIGATIPDTFRRILTVRWTLIFALVTVSAPLLALENIGARSFLPPDVGIIALLATIAVSQAREPSGRIAACASLLVVGLAGFSGSRTAFLLAAVSFLVVVYANRTARVLAMLAVIGALVFMVASGDVVADLRAGVKTRASARIFQLLSPGGSDISTGRFHEAGLILHDMRGRSPLWTVVGIGHGATFEPESWEQERTISAEGFVHNIHIGPLLMLFRYGLVGLILYLVVALSAAVTALRSWLPLLRGRAPPADATTLLYSAGTTLFAVDFLARNVLPNPMFSFFLAGFIATKWLGLNEPAGATSAGGVPAAPERDADCAAGQP